MDKNAFLVMPVCEHFVCGITWKFNFLSVLSTEPLLVDAVVDSENRFSILALYANSRDISYKSTFPSALPALARITPTSERALSGLQYMLATFLPGMLHKNSPSVTAGLGEFSREAKSLVCRAGEDSQRECSL